MKKLIFICFLFSAFTTLQAQEHYLGLQGSTNFTHVNGWSDYWYYSEAKAGYRTGLSYEMEWGDTFSVGAQLSYATRVHKQPVTVKGYSWQGGSLYPYRYHYFTMPIQVGWFYKDRFLGAELGKKFYMAFKPGLIPAYLRKAEKYILIDNSAESAADHSITSKKVNATSENRKFDLAAIVELQGGLEFNERFRAFTSLAFQQSLTSFRPNYSPFANQPSIPYRHYSLNLSLGLQYQL